MQSFLRSAAPCRAVIATLAGFLCVGLAVFAALAARPFDLAAAHGLYEREGEGAPFHWTGSRVTLPLVTSGGPTLSVLKLASGRWPDRPPPAVILAADGHELTRFTAPDQPRTYRLLLPSQTASLTLHAGVARPSGDDPRWLGVQLLDLHSVALGPPLRAIALACAAALAGALAALGLSRWVQRGWAPIIAVTILGLGLRLLAIEQVPAGFFQDEAVSLVDAWHIAQTGRDHLGHWMPLGAFESFGDWVSPLLAFTQIPVVALLGPVPLAGRLVAALAGTLAVAAVYAVARALGLPAAAALIAALAAALSPWQIVRTRVATPPALVPLCWLLCLLAAILLVRHGRRRDALLLALAAGFGLHSYPPMKLAVPLLVACASMLALWCHGWRVARSWLGPAALLAVLWLPFVWVTLANPDSGMRASRIALRAETPAAWVNAWAAGYASYWSPEFLYLTGNAANGIAGRGVELIVTAPLALAGSVALARRCWTACAAERPAWWLLAVALLIAPLPASLMNASPHLTRAIAAAPGYALLVGIGAAALWATCKPRKPPINAHITKHIHTFASIRVNSRIIFLAAIIIALLAEGGVRYTAFLREFPLTVERKYQDGVYEGIKLAVAYAPQFDEVWIDDGLAFPYIYVLAARALPPAEAQAQIEVARGFLTFNTVRRIGPYRFVDVKPVPTNIPTLEAVPTSLGRPRIILQEWHETGRRVLVVRSVQ